MKATVIIKPGFVAYHLSNGKIDKLMVLAKDCGGYKDQPCQMLVDDGWSFVCRTKKFNIGDKIWYKPWPKTSTINNKKNIPCLKCERIGKTCWPCLPFVLEEGCSIKKYDPQGN